MTAGTEPLLQVRGLSVSLGGEDVLRHVDLDVRRRTIHALVGPNGAGKTTLIRSLLGGMAHRGEIRFRFRQSGRVGYVPQLLEFDHRLPMTVCDFLAAVCQRRPVFTGVSSRVRSRIAQVLEQTGAAHVTDRRIGSLSGGELRRVLFAQALFPEPELLLLDEPMSHVDLFGAQRLEALLLRLRDAQGVTVIMVGHDIPSLMRTVDQVTALNRAVTYSGSPEGLENALHGSRSG